LGSAAPLGSSALFGACTIIEGGSLVPLPPRTLSVGAVDRGERSLDRRAWVEGGRTNQQSRGRRRRWRCWTGTGCSGPGLGDSSKGGRKSGGHNTTMTLGDVGKVILPIPPGSLRFPGFLPGNLSRTEVLAKGAFAEKTDDNHRRTRLTNSPTSRNFFRKVKASEERGKQ